MALQDPTTYTAADLANPGLDDATLRHIAQYRPDLRGLVLQHPACSPMLAQMIHASGAPQQAPGRSVPSVPQAPAGFNLGQAAATQQPQHYGQAQSQPSGQPQPYGQQQSYGQQPQGPAQQNSQPPYGAQPQYGAPAPAYGQQPQAYAQGYAQPQPFAHPQHPQARAWAQWFHQQTGRVPAAADYQAAVAAGHIPRESLAGMSGVAGKPGIPAHLGALGRLLFLVPIGALIAIIGTFLPVVDIEMFGERFTANYWVGGADGPIILVCSIVAIAVAVLAFVKPARWSYLLAGIVATLSQILLFVSAIAAIVQSADIEVPLGPAPFFVLAGAIVVVVGAVITMVTSRKL